MTSGIIKQLCWLLASFTIGACALFPPDASGDLKFQSVRVVEWNNLPITTRRDIESFDDHPRKIGELTFASNSDMVGFAQKTDTVSFTAVACKDWNKFEAYDKLLGEIGSVGEAAQPPAALMNVGLNLFFHELPVISNDQNLARYNALPEQWRKQRPFVYQMYFDIKREPYKGYLPANIPPPPIYDLQQQPEDICFQIRGGAHMLGVPGKGSNVLVIPKDAIATALVSEHQRN